jgi:hypothetical protein
MLGQRTVKYTTRCEVYSFGILLWEIAEQKTPYENYNDILQITDLVVRQKYRESFSLGTGLPKKYQEISREGFYIIQNFFILKREKLFHLSYSFLLSFSR